jgi:hypothetical protein
MRMPISTFDVEPAQAGTAAVVARAATARRGLRSSAAALAAAARTHMS